MSVYRPKNSPYYHFDFQFKGNRFYGSTGCTTERKALEYERRERHKAALPEQSLPPITVDEACGIYMEYAEHLPSWPTVKYMLEAIISHFGKRKMLSEITQRDFQAFVARRRNGRANSSVNRELENVRAVWKRASVSGFDVGGNIHWNNLRLKVSEKAPRELARAEQDGLEASYSKDVADICEFAVLSGWRKSEVVALRWSDCDFPNMQAATKIKGGNTVRRAMSSRMVAILRRQPKVGPFVFTYECRKSRGKRRAGERYPMTVTALRTRWKEAKTKAGVEDLRFHDLRHTAGTRILRETGNLAAAKKALQHQNIKTTLRYAHVLDDDVRNALEAAESRNIPEENVKEIRKGRKC